MPDPITLGRAAFEAWLRSKRPQQIVGYRMAPMSCPVANWIEAATGRQVYVRCPDWRFYGEDEQHALPGWADAFAEAVDQRRRAAVSARTCLRLLAQLPEAPDA
jgi:hypothetical protein